MPTAPAFSHRPVLAPLATNEARHLFLDLAPRIMVADPCLDMLLHELGGVPLAIELTACRAAPDNSLQDLWDEWQRLGLRLAAHPDLPAGRLTSVERSIELSLQSGRLREEGRRLFRLLGHLPAGMAREDRVALLGDEAAEAARQPLATGLAFSRILARAGLATSGAAFRPYYTPGAPDIDRCTRHYLGLLNAIGPCIGTALGAGAIERLKREIANLGVVFVAVPQSEARQAADATEGFARLLCFVGLGSLTPFGALADACSAAETSLGQPTV